MKNLYIIAVVLGAILLGAGCASVRPPSGEAPVERRMLVTGYCPCQKCCEWHRNWLFRPVYSSGPLKGKRKDVGMTASGVRARHGTIAADTRRYAFGTVMKIDGYGMGRVEDQGGAIKGDHIDLFFDSHQDAVEWGKRYVRVLIWYR